MTEYRGSACHCLPARGGTFLYNKCRLARIVATTLNHETAFSLLNKQTMILYVVVPVRSSSRAALLLPHLLSIIYTCNIRASTLRLLASSLPEA
jgi:hypothetical protein